MSMNGSFCLVLDAQAHQELGAVARRLDLGAAVAGLVERVPHVVGGHDLRGLHLHQRAAREVDRPARAAVRHQPGDGGEHDGEREHVEVPAVLHEVDVACRAGSGSWPRGLPAQIDSRLSVRRWVMMS